MGFRYCKYKLTGTKTTIGKFNLVQQFFFIYNDSFLEDFSS